MPPYKKALVKRKADLDVESKAIVTKNFNAANKDNDDDDPDLFVSLSNENDNTDSEADNAGEDSDEEEDGVLFDSDAEEGLSSTSGNLTFENSSEDEESSEDSEEDDEEGSEEDDEQGSEEDNGESSENASQDESGIDSDSEHSDFAAKDVKTDLANKKGKNQKQDTVIETKKRNGAAREKETVKEKVTGDKDKALATSLPNIKKKNKNKGNALNKAMAKLQTEVIKNSTEENKKDEYASGDSSDEEDRRNTVGNIPMWWYNDYPHIGYNLDGQKLIKPPQRDQIEEFLKRCEDPDFWRTVRDPTTGQDIVLSKEDLELISRIKQGQTPSSDYEEYPLWVEWFSSEVLKTPLRAFPEHKRSFLPSETDKKKISKLVHALKMGWIKTRKEEREEYRKKKERQFYMLWGSGDDNEERMRGIHRHIPAPKRPLPSHAESYNPPPEYLLDNKEMKQWNKLKNQPWKRKYTFLPQKFDSLRTVPAYDRFIRERFLRCLDLYLAPRAIKMRLTINPQDLIPKLPSPRDLQPFPTTESLIFKGHTDMVRSIDTDPTGQYLVSGSDDGNVKIWEMSTGRCLRTISVDGVVRCVAWTPIVGLSLIAVAVDKKLLLLNPGAGIGDHDIAEKTDELLEEPPANNDVIVEERTRTACQWDKVAPENWVRGVRISVSHFKEVKHVHWHARGDYICVTLPDGASRSVIVHQLSKRRSQLPFSKAKGLVQCALFHPIRPLMFVATQRVVRIYDLVKQELVKKLLTGAQWISTMAVHPAGDNLIVATYDRKMMWFDLDLSSKPYQTLRLHGTAVRGVAFHKRYPLFASGGDDKKIIVSHGMVYNDLLQNPLIVPLKQLYGHEVYNDFGILDVKFHPYQPWVISAGADKTIRLYT